MEAFSQPTKASQVWVDFEIKRGLKSSDINWFSYQDVL